MLWYANYKSIHHGFSARILVATFTIFSFLFLPLLSEILDDLQRTPAPQLLVPLARNALKEPTRPVWYVCRPSQCFESTCSLMPHNCIHNRSMAHLCSGLAAISCTLIVCVVKTIVRTLITTCNMMQNAANGGTCTSPSGASGTCTDGTCVPGASHLT
jgi:hypothetical protein